MLTLLITGFEPFGGWTSNPSQRIAEALDGETISGARMIGLTLPLAYGEDTRRVLPMLAQMRPAALLSFGLDAGARSIHVEMFAVNHRRGDPQQQQQISGGSLVPIDPDGPAAYFATIDAERVAQAIRESAAGIDAKAHGYAGSYLCNHVFYQSLHYAAMNRLDCRVGFIHVPPTIEDAAAPQPMHSIDTLIAAARVVAEEVIAQCDASGADVSLTAEAASR